MKKLKLLFCAVALVFTSCTLSNEDKAEKLIKESLKGTLYHPESYEPISTRVDSAFINIENLVKVGELFEYAKTNLRTKQNINTIYDTIEKLKTNLKQNNNIKHLIVE